MQTAIAAIAEAVTGGASLVIFPETFLPGYRAWIWRLRPGNDSAISGRLHSRLLENSVRLKRSDLCGLTDAARKFAVTIICGVDERDDEFGGSK